MVDQRLGAVVAGAHGNALLVQQGADVVRVYVARHEGQQGRIGGVRRQHGDALDRRQARHRLRAQGVHVGVDGCAPHLVDELRGGRQADGAAHVGRAAFQPGGQGGIAGAVVFDPLDHVAAQAQRVQALQRRAPAGQHAGAHGPVHLVAREGHEVAGQGGQLGHGVAGRLRGVQHGERAGLRGQQQHLFIGWALAGRVGPGRHGKHARALGQQALQIGRVQAACGVGAQHEQPGAAGLRRLLPGDQVGVVLQAAHDDLVARAQPGLARAAQPQALGDEVERLGGARGEDQLVLGSGADEALEHGARGLEVVGGALAQRVHAAVDVGAVARLEDAHGLQHRQRHLGGGAVVQVGQRCAMHRLRQHRKLRAQGRHVQRAVVQEGVGFTHGRAP